MFCVSFAHAERLWILAGRVSIDRNFLVKYGDIALSMSIVKRVGRHFCVLRDVIIDIVAILHTTDL